MAEARAVVQGNTHHDKVVDVCAMRLDWNLVVGVVRMYELPIPSNPSDLYQVDMILQDKEGDRILCSIPKADFEINKTLIKEFGIYKMQDFIVQPPSRGVRQTCHRFRLTFYRRTSVSRLPTNAFSFSLFRMTSFHGVEEMTAAGQFHLIDCVGHVVGKEEVVNMV
ncbi:hypothetical protein PIB30_065003 [Stylosanthes scabra]|uniref:Replication protein A 70 kDa DNA-binding subunit B/D first OB fold domain-containing protein n=1 Tax=Stylosanthes scabra TaxID=79078 RepID=A0ABU6TLP9_9FABA|nr:hypothetical protein [Stylosanthes scabra]